MQQSIVGMNSGVEIGGVSMEWPIDQAGGIRSGYWSFDHLDGDTLVIETHRYKDGHELSIIESIRVEGEYLIYKHKITGPGGKREESEVIFEV